MIAVLLLSIVSAQLNNQPIKTLQPFHYKILDAGSSLLIDSQCPTCTIFNKREKKNSICSQEEQYYVEKEHEFIIEANKPFTVDVNTDIQNIVTSNGISRSVIDNNSLGHRSEVIVLSRCRRD